MTEHQTPPTTRFVFVRHGKADDVEGRCIGHHDAPLSAQGAGDIRAMTVPRFATLFSSDLRRARDSALILAGKHSAGESTPIVAGEAGSQVNADRRLREMHFGEWEGRSWQDLEQQDGARLQHWMEQWTIAAPPGGERLDDVHQRVREWLDEQLSEIRDADRTLVVVSHAGAIRVALCYLLSYPLAELFTLPVDHAHMTVVDVCGTQRQLVAMNVRQLDERDSG